MLELSKKNLNLLFILSTIVGTGANDQDTSKIINDTWLPKQMLFILIEWNEILV